MKYRTIVADPPWPESGKNMFRPEGFGSPGSKWTYPLMTYAEIDSIRVADLADDEAHLYLWATQRSLEHAFTTCRAWGFDYKMTLVWVKTMGLGFRYFRHSVEFVLFCTRGNLETRSRNVLAHFFGPKGKHSQKPECFYDMVIQESPAPLLEMFSRRHRMGWDVWGNEVDSEIVL